MFSVILCSSERLIGAISIGAIALLAVVIVLLVGAERKTNVRTMAYGAICTALSFGLSLVRIPMPLGGAVTLASMLPLIIFAYAYGIVPAVMTGLVFALLQFVFEPYFLTPIQFILDYLLAFGSVALAAFFGKAKRRKVALISATVVVITARFVCHVLAGIIYFEQGIVVQSLPLFGATDGYGAIVYSMMYNCIYMLPELLLTVLLAASLAASNSFMRLLPLKTKHDDSSAK